MNPFKSFKNNFGVYLFHFLFVCIIAPYAFSFISFLLNDSNNILQKGFIDNLIFALFAPILSILYGSFISIPLAILSLFTFKMLMDKKENKVKYFCIFGALFGALVHAVFFSIGGESTWFAFLIFEVVGVLTGYFLYPFWNSYYKRNEVST